MGESYQKRSLKEGEQTEIWVGLSNLNKEVFHKG